MQLNSNMTAICVSVNCLYVCYNETYQTLSVYDKLNKLTMNAFSQV